MKYGAFIKSLREALEQVDLPVITAQLNRYTGPHDIIGHTGWSIVREAQRRAVAMGHLAVVSTLDLSISDLIHTSSPGNILLGARKACAALGMVYGKQVHWRSPDVVAGRLEEDGAVIVLTFNHVENRLEFLGPGDEDFIVKDMKGIIKIINASCTDKDTVRLELERPTNASARVHGGFGAYPVSNLRDAETNVPILGFYDLHVQ